METVCLVKLGTTGIDLRSTQATFEKIVQHYRLCT